MYQKLHFGLIELYSFMRKQFCSCLGKSLKGMQFVEEQVFIFMAKKVCADKTDVAVIFPMNIFPYTVLYKWQ